MTEERPGYWIDTYMGHHFWVLDPREEEVYIRDIAHALSLMCRFNGLCSEFYSIGQHSLLVSENCPEEFQLYGLLHDAAEAYVSDVPTPVKKCIKGFKEIEDGIMKVIFNKYGLGDTMPEEVKNVDHSILHDEATVLMPGGRREWIISSKGLGLDIVPMKPAEVEEAFMRRFYELTNPTKE